MPDNLAAEVVRLRRELAQVKKGSRIAHGASIEDSALEVKDSVGSLRAVVGQQPDGTTAVNIVNGPPPPTPSTPLLASVLGGVTASWDGQFTDAVVAPLDWQRVEVHSSTADGFTPDITTLRATIETAQGGTVVVTCDAPVYVRLLARNTSGTAGVPSAQAGPLGPAPVVASDILDGIVTTVKLADDAVTQAKVATGAIGTTEISDEAVTTPKIVAGAVQAAQIDAGAVNASKIASGAVTTAKLDALAVTSDKINANAITAGMIQAGAIDATALAADAITGKTITGGTITGTTISGATVTGTTVTGGTIQTGTTGGRVVVTPTPPAGIAARPSVMFYSGTPGELFPGILNGGTDTSSRPVVVLTSPVASTDAGGNYPQSGLSLGAPIRNSQGGHFFLTTTAPYNLSDNGVAYIEALAAKNTTDISQLVGVATDGGASSPKTSLTKLTGTTFTVTTDTATHTFSSTGVSLSGVLTAGNMATGSVNIVPSAASVPTSALVTFNVTGTTVRGFATAQTTVPGVRAPVGSAGVTGVGVSSATNTSMLVWVNRENTTSTTVNWQVTAS